MKIKKISSFLSAVFLAVSLCSTTVPASDGKEIAGGSVEVDKSGNAGEKVLAAAEEEDLGSITVTLQDTDGSLPKKGVSFALIKAADVAGGEFRIKEPFASSGVDLNSIQNANEVEAAASRLSKIAGIKGDMTLVTDANGMAKAENLPVGVYLIFATDISGYEDITPCLVSIPTFDGESGEMVYDLEVLPKHTPLPQPEGRSLPQTGVENKAFEYAVMSVGFLILAGAAGIGMAVLKNRKKKQSR